MKFPAVGRRVVRAAGAAVASLLWSGTVLACDLPPLPGSAAPPVIFRLDDSRSLVQFAAQAFLHDFTGKTSRVQGTIRLGGPERLAEAEACIRIDAATLDTGIRARDATMREEHLETRKFPTIAFDLTRVEQVQAIADGWAFGARGLLTLHGVQREILLPMRARREAADVRLTGDVSLKMSDYAIRAPKLLFIVVEDQVRVSFDLMAVRVP